jgi:hypothetical protein
MDIAIEFNPAAFRHDVSEAEADIRLAIMNALCDDVLDTLGGTNGEND